MAKMKPGKVKKFMEEEKAEGENPKAEMKKMGMSMGSGKPMMDDSEKRASKVAAMMRGKRGNPGY